MEDQKRVCQVLEMIHAAGLYHDDVIDNAESRRSRPSINNVWGIKKVWKRKNKIKKITAKANDIYLVNFSWGFRPGSVDENNRRN